MTPLQRKGTDLKTGPTLFEANGNRSLKCETQKKRDGQIKERRKERGEKSRKKANAGT